MPLLQPHPAMVRVNPERHAARQDAPPGEALCPHVACALDESHIVNGVVLHIITRQDRRMTGGPPALSRTAPRGVKSRPMTSSVTLSPLQGRYVETHCAESRRVP